MSRLPSTQQGSGINSVTRFALHSVIHFDDMQKKITDEDLSQIGLRVVSLLQNKEFEKIGANFDYALTYERSTAQAIEEDLERAIAECESTESLNVEKTEIKVSHFEHNSPGLKTLVECYCQLSEEKGVLVELILPVSGPVYIEDISSSRNDAGHIQSEVSTPFARPSLTP